MPRLQMKLSVVFLLCFVATTYQHHLRNYHFYEPRLALYYPLLSNQQFGFHDSVRNELRLTTNYYI